MLIALGTPKLRATVGFKLDEKRDDAPLILKMQYGKFGLFS